MANLGNEEINRKVYLAELEKFLELLADDPRVIKLQELFDSE